MNHVEVVASILSLNKRKGWRSEDRKPNNFDRGEFGLTQKYAFKTPKNSHEKLLLETDHAPICLVGL